MSDDFYADLLGRDFSKKSEKLAKDGKSKKQRKWQDKQEAKKSREIDACIRKGQRDKSTQGGERMKMGGK